ncbi:MAG: hypothetical protein Q4B67_10170, partial [Eubacteriales bacterium]|nr:hypothetical protein [Eubacteriales bacterium]
VKVTAAKVDISSNAITDDALDATLVDDTTKITATNYTVNLGTDFTGASTVIPGDDYTFTAKDKNYNYTFTGTTMGGTEVSVIDNGDGTYTIQNVTGNIVIASTKTAKTFTVTKTGTGAADITGAATATYFVDYEFTITKDDKYDYELTATVGGNDYSPVLVDDTYSILGEDVTGNIVITVNKTLKPVTTTQITFEGTGSADVAGGTLQTAQNGQDFKFEVTKDSNYDYVVTFGGNELTEDAEGKYTIPAASITGTALTVTVAKTAKKTINVEASAYVQLDGKTMYLVTATGTVAAGKTLAYDGTAMYQSSKYSAYTWLVISNKSADEVKTEAEGKIAEATATSTSIAYDNDVNKTGRVDINDAQLTWDIYNAKYDSFVNVSMEKFLSADVNGDKVVNVTDATAIIAAIQ